MQSATSRAARPDRGIVAARTPLFFRKTTIFLLLATFLLTPASVSRAQLPSNPAAVNLQAVINPMLAIVAGPGLVNFNLVQNGVANGDSAITITTAWVLHPSVRDVQLYGYFTSPPAALTDGAGSNIPSSRVRGSVNGGPFSPFTGASPYSGTGSLLLFTQRILGNNRNSRRTDTLNLQIDLTGTTLRPGTYTGVLRLQARAL